MNKARGDGARDALRGLCASLSGPPPAPMRAPPGRVGGGGQLAGRPAGRRPWSGTALDAAGQFAAAGDARLRDGWHAPKRGSGAPVAAVGACSAAGRLPGTACRHVGEGGGGGGGGGVWTRRPAIAGPSARLNTPCSAAAPMTPRRAANTVADHAQCAHGGGGAAVPAGRLGRHLGRR